MSRIRACIALTLFALMTATVSTVAVHAQTTAFVAPVRSYELIATYPHDTAAYTQGLILVDGELYEGTGLRGASELRLVDLHTGFVEKRHALGDEHFGEGITVLGDRIYQLTWQTHTAFVYERATFEQIGTFSYSTEGWGLTNDGSNLIMSDGSDQLFIRDPETFEVIRQISVRDGETPVTRLNELEYIDGVIWANVYQTNLIARIDPESGSVIDWLDLSALQAEAAASGDQIDVLNGIAWNPETQTAYVTGKLWPYLFEIEVNDEN